MSTNINIRLPEDLKADAEILFADMGISLSEGIRLFIKQTINCGGLPFTPKAKSPNRITQESFKQVQTGEYQEMTLDEFKTLLDDEEF